MNLSLYNTPAATDKKPAYAYTSSDRILAVCLWVVGYLICLVAPVMDAPVPAFLLVTATFVGTAVFLSRPVMGGRVGARGWCVVAVTVMLSLSLLLTTNRVLVNGVFLWNCAAWFYLVFTATGNSREGLPGSYFVGEFLTAACLAPFRAPGHLFGAIFGGRREPDGDDAEGKPRGRAGATLGWVLLGLLLAAVPTLIVCVLLSYDKAFVGILNDLEELISAAEIFRQLRNGAVGLLLGALMFGAILAGRAGKANKPRETSNPVAYTPVTAAPESGPRDGAHVFPVPLMAAALTPLFLVYVIFFISQWDYYLSAFTGVRPAELTFADYAREGFFQLLAVTVINTLAALAVANFTVRRPADEAAPRRDRTHPLMRVYTALLAVFTLILIATALSKMFLYVNTYGMTHKRTYATWLMLLLAACFLALLIRQAVSRMNLTATVLVLFLAFLTVLSVVNVDALILSHNTDAALGGNLRALRGGVCEDCGYSGVPAALEFMAASEDPSAIPLADYGMTEGELAAVRAEVGDYLHRMAEGLEDMKWYGHNLVTLRARAALAGEGY